jgi:N-acetylneuraminic acid mutarotase
MKRINIALFSLMLLGVLFSCSKASLNYTQNGNWVSRASFPGVPMGAGASFVVGNHAYVGTGINPNDPNHRLTTMYRYTAAPYNTSSPTGFDSAYGAWTQVSDFAGSPRSNAVTFTIGSSGYLGAGKANDGFTPLNDFYRYDTLANNWTRIADLANDSGTAFPRFDAVSFSFDTTAFVLTGTDNLYYFADVWQYSPTANAWTQQAYMPGSPRSAAISWVYKGQGYLLTGFTPGSQWAVGTACYDFWRFDPTPGTTTPWIRLRDISNTSAGTYDDGYTNIIRSAGVGFVILGTQSGDKGYITTGSNGTLYSFTWEYDFATDLWTEKTPYEGPARTNAVGFTIQNRGFVSTGLSGTTTGYQDVREFFPNQIYNQYD